MAEKFDAGLFEEALKLDEDVSIKSRRTTRDESLYFDRSLGPRREDVEETSKGQSKDIREGQKKKNQRV